MLINLPTIAAPEGAVQSRIYTDMSSTYYVKSY